MSTALAQTPPNSTPAPSSAAAGSKSGSLQIVNAQGHDEWLASKLKGTTVVGSDDQKIGSVVDILLDKTGQVRAFIVGVGGVLGLGAKEVAVELTEFREVPAADGNREQLRLAMTKDQLAQVAEFKPLPDPAVTTTGAAPSGARPPGSPTTAPR